jgi:DNA-binding IclR family transcriptional regulator
VSYERGKAMPLFRGAPSKAILAQLPDAALDEIAAGHGRELRDAGLPASPRGLRDAIAALRAEQVLCTRGEVDPQVIGWAVALRNRKSLLGSLSLVLSHSAGPLDAPRLADQLRRAALRIEGRLQD